MKTNNYMKRQLPITGINGEVYEESTIRQRTKDGYFNATDLLKLYNKATNSNKKMNDYLKHKQTKEFIEVIKSKDENNRLLTKTENGEIGLSKPVYETKQGRYGGTWMHPMLFLDFAMCLSPEFKYIAIRWLHDELIQYRNSSGDHYNEMGKAITKHYYKKFGKKPDSEIYKKEAKLIRDLVELDYNKDWDEASERQLKLRDKLEQANIFAHKQQYSKEDRWQYLQNIKETFSSYN